MDIFYYIIKELEAYAKHEPGDLLTAEKLIIILERAQEEMAKMDAFIHEQGLEAGKALNQ